MLTKFWESVGEGLSEKWLSLLGPSFVFWAGGLFILVGWNGLAILSKTLLALEVGQQVALLVGTLVLLLGSSSILQRLSYPILRLLEGYWPFPFYWLSLLLIKWQSFWISHWEHRWQNLEKKRSENKLSMKELRDYSNLERRLHYIPSNPNNFMPTVLGNILRMAETQPGHKYGLDGVVCWPRLWPLLSDKMREELGKARQSLNQAAELWAWGMLFLVWGFKSWWAILIGLIWAWVAYQMTLNNAVVYADLIESAFDIYRGDLYKALRWPLPRNPAEEREKGQALTAYLWRGSESDKPIFIGSNE